MNLSKDRLTSDRLVKILPSLNEDDQKLLDSKFTKDIYFIIYKINETYELRVTISRRDLCSNVHSSYNVDLAIIKNLLFFFGINSIFTLKV